MGKWVDDLWGREKLTNETYGNYALRLRKGYAGRKRDLEAVMAKERARRAGERVQEVNRALSLVKKPLFCCRERLGGLLPAGCFPLESPGARGGHGIWKECLCGIPL